MFSDRMVQLSTMLVELLHISVGSRMNVLAFQDYYASWRAHFLDMCRWMMHLLKPVRLQSDEA